MSVVVTLDDVAAAAGVHPSTASRALNPATADMVSARTRKRVVEAGARLGYRPNAHARGLRTQRSMTIGVLIPDITNPVFPPMLLGAEAVLADAGYAVVIANSNNEPERAESTLRTMRANSVDGLLIATALRDDPLMSEVRASGIPTVLINRSTDTAELAAVAGDEAAGIHQAVQHLAESGHTRIAYLAGPLNSSTGHLRLAAFRTALEEFGIEFVPSLAETCNAYSIDAGREGLNRLLDRSDEFSAVLASNDLLAMGCYRAARSHGLRIPDDLSVIGFNDMPFVDQLTPQLTTVRIPQREIGEFGARMLLDQLASGRRNAHALLLPTELRIRESVRDLRLRVP